MYKIIKEINILGSNIFYYRVLKKKWFILPHYSKKVFSNQGYGRFLLTKTKEEAQTLIDIMNK